MEDSKQKTLDNLKMVLVELPKLAKKYPEIKTDFNMDIYGVYEYRSTLEVTQGICGTTGCLAGNIARLFKPKPEYFSTNDQFNYDHFLMCEFPHPYDGYHETEVWDFLFSAVWSPYQPTFEHALERIKYVIDNDLKISPWSYREESYIHQNN